MNLLFAVAPPPAGGPPVGGEYYQVLYIDYSFSSIGAFTWRGNIIKFYILIILFLLSVRFLGGEYYQVLFIDYSFSSISAFTWRPPSCCLCFFVNCLCICGSCLVMQKPVFGQALEIMRKTRMKNNIIGRGKAREREREKYPGA